MTQMFSGGQLKSRIIRLSQKRSENKTKLKYILALPLLAIILSLSAFKIPKDYGLINLSFMIQEAAQNSPQLTLISGTGTEDLSKGSPGPLKDDLNSTDLSAADSPVSEEKNKAADWVIRANKTSQLRTASTVGADTIPLKFWAPQHIRDSVTKYELAARVISNQMMSDGHSAREILDLIQKERFNRYRKFRDSSQKAIADSGTYGTIHYSSKDLMYNLSPDDEVPDELMRERLKDVDVIINRIENSYIEMQRLLEMSNTLRSKVRDSFPMYVSKNVPNLAYYISHGDKKIPSPFTLYKGSWVKSETERLAFFATSE